MKEEQIEYDKQQLEYIKEWFKSEETAPFMTITYEYFVNLIEWSEERLRLIERVQGLELSYKKTIKIQHNQIVDLVAQNKRYRETMSIALGMIQYNRTDKENEIYKLLGDTVEEAKGSKIVEGRCVECGGIVRGLVSYLCSDCHKRALEMAKECWYE